MSPLSSCMYMYTYVFSVSSVLCNVHVDCPSLSLSLSSDLPWYKVFYRALDKISELKLDLQVCNACVNVHASMYMCIDTCIGLAGLALAVEELCYQTMGPVNAMYMYTNYSKIFWYMYRFSFHNGTCTGYEVTIQQTCMIHVCVYTTTYCYMNDLYMHVYM